MGAQNSQDGSEWILGNVQMNPRAFQDESKGSKRIPEWAKWSPKEFHENQKGRTWNLQNSNIQNGGIYKSQTFMNVTSKIDTLFDWKIFHIMLS